MTVCTMCGRNRRRYRQNGMTWWLADFLDACPWCDLLPAKTQAPLHDFFARAEREGPSGTSSVG